jgi:hypothetical protein
LVTYVETIEPRLTPARMVEPAVTADALAEWCRDLTEELSARLGLVTQEDLTWQPHPDSNGAGVTVWHVARWLDVLGSRAFTGKPAAADCWHQFGWRELTGYEPDGIGYLGLGTLTGYTPQQMRAVPVLDATSLRSYLTQTADRLIEQIAVIGARLHQPTAHSQLTPYQQIAMTLQGSFGHVGEIDTLVALRARL